MAAKPVLRVLMAIRQRPWAITPEGMCDIEDIVGRHMDGTVDMDAVAARYGQPVENTSSVEVRGSTAIIPVTGPIFRYANLMTQFSGATSVEALATDLQAAVDAPGVDQILLNIDSPGGQVDGILELADMVREASKKKRVTAYVDGLGASGAYWIASAANGIVLNEGAFVGSIGVVASVTDNRDQQEKRGVRRYEIVSSQSPYKRPDVATDAGRAQIQEMVDSMASLFISRVAAFRNLTSDKVQADFGQGKLLSARQAIAAGMADDVSNFEPLVARLAADTFSIGRVEFSSQENKMAEQTNAITSNSGYGITTTGGTTGTTPPNASPVFTPQPTVLPITVVSGPTIESDRQRIKAILESEEAQGREPLARKLALETDHDVPTVREFLNAAPRGNAIEKPANQLEAAMARVANPVVGPSVEDDKSDAAEARRILAFVPKNMKAAV